MMSMKEDVDVDDDDDDGCCGGVMIIPIVADPGEEIVIAAIGVSNAIDDI